MLSQANEAPQVVDTQAPESIQNGTKAEKVVVPQPTTVYYGQQPWDHEVKHPGSKTPKRRICGLPLLEFILYAITILILLAAVGIAAGVAGSEATRRTAALRRCQQNYESLVHSSKNQTNATPGPPFTSTCSSMDSWHSNLTNFDYTQVCNFDISHRGSKFTLPAGAVVDSFDACVTMCDVLNWSTDNPDIAIAAWSWGGNSSSGVGVNPLGQCWCVQSGDGQYSMKLHPWD
jgi:hypothetical protein